MLALVIMHVCVRVFVSASVYVRVLIIEIRSSGRATKAATRNTCA